MGFKLKERIGQLAHSELGGKRPRLNFVLMIIVVLASLTYIYAFSDSNISRHRKLNSKIKMMDAEIEKLESHLENAHTSDEIKHDPVLLEHHIREQLNMKRAGEDVFMIDKDGEDEKN